MCLKNLYLMKQRIWLTTPFLISFFLTLFNRSFPEIINQTEYKSLLLLIIGQALTILKLKYKIASSNWKQPKHKAYKWKLHAYCFKFQVNLVKRHYKFSIKICVSLLAFSKTVFYKNLSSSYIIIKGKMITLESLQFYFS